MQDDYEYPHSKCDKTINDLQQELKYSEAKLKQYEHQLEVVSTVLGKLHPIGKVKAIGYLEVETALRDVVDDVNVKLDPLAFSPFRNVTELIEMFRAAKAAIQNK